MSEINISEQDRLHQLLCAYVLGEADAGERVEVEAALAKDPALREERARLEATIGMVQGALGKDETLSYQATNEVTRAASLLARGPETPVRALPWYRATPLRAAASIVAVVGASFLGWKAFVAGPMNLRDSAQLGTELAKLDPQAKASGRADNGGLYLPRAEVDVGLDAAASKAAEQNESSLGEALQAAARKEPGSAPEEFPYNPALVQGSKLAPSQESEQAAQDRRAALNTGAEKALREQIDRLGLPQEPQPTTALNAADGNSSELFYLGAKVEEAKRGLDGSSQPVSGAAQGRLASGVSGASAPGSPAPTTVARVAGATPGNPGGAGGGPGAKPAQASAAAANGPASPGAVTAGLPAPKDRFADAKSKAGALGLGANNLLTPGDPFAEGDALKTLGYLDGESPATRSGELSEFELADSLKKDKSFDDDGADGDFKGRTDNFFLGHDENGERRRILTHAERQAQLEQVIASCRPRPNERPRDMFFRFWGDNPFEWSATDRQSTFSMDVDTASYTLARKYLVEGHLPEKAQIRTEEFVNYFAPDVASPKAGTFAIATELAPGRFVDRPDKWMLRVAVRGKEVPVAERSPLALTFVIDVSGSMKEEQRLELVKNALRMLITQLDARDSVAIVAFSSDTRLMLPMTSAAKRDLIESAIQPLTPDGSTNTEAGLRMGYEQALAALTKNATNRVVLLTDGVANVGITDPNTLVQHVERQRKAGIYLNTIGVGMDNHNDNLLEQLADKGDGLCNYVDDAAEVKHALVDNFLATMVPIARDAKVQVEFDPAQVESYRLLGYENRAIADQDFRNDKIDAGEINSGHQITALYEIVRTGVASNGETPLATVRLRFKPPHKDGIASAASEEASEISKVVTGREAAGSFEATSFGYRRAVLAAQFAEFLRRSVHARGDSLERLIEDLQRLSGERSDAQVVELRDMVLKSKALLEAEFANYGELQRRLDRLRAISFERARLDALQREIDSSRLNAMDQEIAGLERSLREEWERRQVK